MLLYVSLENAEAGYSNVPSIPELIVLREIKWLIDDASLLVKIRTTPFFYCIVCHRIFSSGRLISDRSVCIPAQRKPCEPLRRSAFRPSSHWFIVFEVDVESVARGALRLTWTPPERH
jgi:hypothetical protein